MKKLFVLLLLLSSTRVHALDRFMIKPPAGTSLDFSHHLCKNLILFYPFNERSGKRENASPFYEKYAWNNAANTRFSARVNSGSDVSFLTPHGQWGQCLYGSGALNDMIAITDDDPLKITGQLSLSLWVKQTGSLAAGKQLMGIYRTDNDTRSYGLHVNPDETARFYLSSDGDTTNFDNLASTTLMNDGKWHHLVGTFNPGTSIKLYVDDVLEDEENAPGDVIQSSIYVSATNFRILGYYNGTEISYPGRLDLPMVWNRTLSREEVHQLYSDPFCMFQKPMSLELLEAATSLGDGSSDIVAFDAGASTCFTVIRETDGDVWYPSSQVFETWGTGSRTAADYDIALTDKTGGMFVGDMDTNISAGYYYAVSHQQAGANPADTDPAVWQEYGYWNGTDTWSPATAILSASGVWDAAMTSHTGEATFGGEVQTIDPNVTLILADTGELQTDHADGGRLDLIWDAIKAVTDVIPALVTDVSVSDTTTSFTVTDGNEVADAYNGCVIIVQDAGDSHYEPRMILDWTAGRVVTVGTAYSFTPAVSDKVWIFNTTYLWDIYRKISSTVHYVDTTKTGAGAGQGTGFQRYDAAGDDP